MTTFFALPQPGPPEAAASAARAWSLKIEPRVRQSIPAPPTRSRSRLVIFRFGLQRSLQLPPGILIICSMVKEEGRAVDQSPGQILDHYQTFIFEFFRAGHSIFAQLDQAW